MPDHSEWSDGVPRIIYEAYPDRDLLPIEPPDLVDGPAPTSGAGIWAGTNGRGSL